MQECVTFLNICIQMDHFQCVNFPSRHNVVINTIKDHIRSKTHLAYKEWPSLTRNTNTNELYLYKTFGKPLKITKTEIENVKN